MVADDQRAVARSCVDAQRHHLGRPVVPDEESRTPTGARIFFVRRGKRGASAPLMSSQEDQRSGES